MESLWRPGPSRTQLNTVSAGADQLRIVVPNDRCFNLPICLLGRVCGWSNSDRGPQTIISCVVDKPVFSVLPGLTLACLVGCASMLSRRVPELSFVSPVFLSVIVGMGISSVINLPVSFTPRLSFASRFLLLISIVLLDGGRADRGRHRCSLRMRGSDCINILVYAETCPFVSSKPRTNRSRP